MSSLFTPNFRDVGETINRLSGQSILRPGVLYRSGELSSVEDLAWIRSPRSIINLQNRPDPGFVGAEQWHLPAPDPGAVYRITEETSFKWIRCVLEVINRSDLSLPLLIHCTAGKDRTGVIIGVILALLGVESRLVVEEYRLSSGTLYFDLFSDSIDKVYEARALDQFNLDQLAARIRC